MISMNTDLQNHSVIMIAEVQVTSSTEHVAFKYINFLKLRITKLVLTEHIIFYFFKMTVI